MRFPTIVAVVGSLLLAACGATLPTRPGDQPVAVCTPAPASASAVVEVAPPKPTRPPRVALALGGGAARGFAHIGVIEVLEENGIHPDLVTGTSAGSLVAALYASGRTGKELEAIAVNMDESALTDWSFPGRGLIRGEALAKFVRDKTGNRQIEQMKIPLGIAATDLDSGEGILFQRGDTGTAVRASSAVPAVFQPVKIGAREYVDGGLSAPVPVHHARAMGAEFVIAVDISAVPQGNPTSDLARMLMQTFSIMGRSIKGYELRDADLVLVPKLPGVAGTDFSTRKQSIRAGREATLAQIAELRERLAAKGRALSPA